jgi:hypothetical protein
MKHKVILGSAAILTAAVGVSVAIYAAIDNSGKGPASSATDSGRSGMNKASTDGVPSVGADKASENKPGASAAALPQTAAQTSTDASLPPSPATPPASATAGKFIGTWVLDPARSEGLDLGMTQAMVVTQSGQVMNVKTTLRTPQRGEWTVTDTYTLNGQETEFLAEATGGAAVKGKRTSRLTNDGSGLEATERATMAGAGASVDVNTTRRWMIAADKSLVIEMKIEGANVYKQHKRVFVKQ